MDIIRLVVFIHFYSSQLLRYWDKEPTFQFTSLCQSIVLFTLNKSELNNQWMMCHGKFIACTNKIFMKLKLF